jgi:hypothetical protein
MAGRRIAWIGALSGSLLAGAAMAEERTFTCPAEGFTVYRDPGLKDALSVVVRTGEPGAIELHGPWGDIALPAAKTAIDADTIFAEAVGSVEVPMPDPAAIDACIAEAERKRPGAMRGRQSADVLRACKQGAPSTGPVPVLLSFAIIAIDSPQATAIIKRGHAGEDEATTERHRVETMAACSLTQP